MKNNCAQSGYNTILPEFLGVVTQLKKKSVQTFWFSKLMEEAGRIENRNEEIHEPECSRIEMDLFRYRAKLWMPVLQL